MTIIKVKKLGAGIVLLCLSMLFHTSWSLAASKDKTPPVITETLNTNEYTNGSVKITIHITDSSSIKSVKWAGGARKISYFSKSGKELKLNSENNVTVSVSKNATYTFYAKDKAGNHVKKKVVITNVDNTKPTISAAYSVMNQKATVTLKTADDSSGVKTIKYIKGSYSVDSPEWEKAGNMVENFTDFQVGAAGQYSILVEDQAGNREVTPLQITMEFRAAWISYLEFLKAKDYNEADFKAYVDKIFDNCVSMNMNAVVVQVRPFSDAMYPSSYFPWSYYASGEQGKALSYDPLEYMIKAAHARNLEFHAWVNPYRVTLGTTDITALSTNNPARVWRENPETERYVLTYGKDLYYNPAIIEVQNLIIKGVKELVKKYDVDGIHFDDYFYPNLGNSYASNFDAAEYKTYASECKAAGKTAKTIVEWRRENVSTLVKRTYKAIKTIDKDCVFGISPAGNISNLMSNSSYYVDIATWMSSSEYVDYICPQIYWSFEHKTAPYATILNNWIAMKTSETVNLYVGLAAYRAGISEKTAVNTYSDIGWSQSNTVLKRQVVYGRNTGTVDGYMMFRYDFMVGSTAKTEMKNLISILD